MAEHIIKVLEVSESTHNVRIFKTTKPEGFSFTPGQTTKLSINAPSLLSKKRPFTFTSIPSDKHLEFTIKMYSDHKEGMTQNLKNIKPDDEFIIESPRGTISFKGPGFFIAGGAGITPFISILRDLQQKKSLKGNTLIFSNKTDRDIINEEELEEMKEQGLRVILTVTMQPS